ncbi:hypothetical protein OH77DRAFT_263487 [Trametes cingulata]|nr:hypothetical protein OH77DRAFT_263487 [Trametes cingulata]
MFVSLLPPLRCLGSRVWKSAYCTRVYPVEALDITRPAVAAAWSCAYSELPERKRVSCIGQQLPCPPPTHSLLSCCCCRHINTSRHDEGKQDPAQPRCCSNALTLEPPRTHTRACGHAHHLRPVRARLRLPHLPLHARLVALRPLLPITLFVNFVLCRLGTRLAWRVVVVLVAGGAAAARTDHRSRRTSRRSRCSMRCRC